MTDPPLAFFDFNFAQFLVNCLAVAGGFLVGYALTWAVSWWIDRTLLRKKTPEIVHRSVRAAGGVAVAVIVALLVFGRGGGGLGGGQGEGIGSGTAGPGSNTESTDPGKKPGPPLPKDTPPPEARIRVTVLGGPDVKDQRFYLVDDDPTPRTFQEAKSAIQAKKDAADPKKMAVEVRFTTQNTLAPDHPAVTRLANWARDTAGLTVMYPAETP